MTQPLSMFHASLFRLMCFSIAVLSMAFASYGHAQSGTSLPSGIVASGSHELKIEPEYLRLVLQVQAQGKDAKTAIKSLAAHKEKVRKALVEMNADSESIEFTSTRLDAGSSENAEQMQYIRMMRMMQQQMNGNAETSNKAMPKVYTATSNLRVQWPLPTKDPDALAILPQGLKDQVSSRDLAGKENKPDLSEEERERLEEMESSMEEQMGYSMSSQGSTEPTIVFVGRASKEQRAELLKEALKDAKESAQETAEALGLVLKDLKTAWPYQDTAPASPSSYMMGSESWNSYEDAEDEDGSAITAATADQLTMGLSVLVVYNFE